MALTHSGMGFRGTGEGGGKKKCIFIFVAERFVYNQNLLPQNTVLCIIVHYNAGAEFHKNAFCTVLVVFGIYSKYIFGGILE